MRFIMRAGLLIILIVTAGCTLVEDASPDDYAEQIFRRYPELRDKPYTEGVVSRIIDGDTIELASGAKVRLIGVDTPEIASGQVEWYGQEAKEFTTTHLLHKTILLFADVRDTDRYGRLLRYIFVEPEDEMFNEMLIREGYANVLTVPPDVTYAQRFRKLEQEARDEQRGLWGTGRIGALSCDDPQIKGNINSRGERIYHVPDSRYYEATIAEMMFCTIEEAEAAGFRAPKN